MAIPLFLHKIFWDINPKNLQPEKYPEYTMERILELGNKKAINWLKEAYGVKRIKNALSKLNLSSKSKNYWKQSL